MPITQPAPREISRKITETPVVGAYHKLRMARSDKKLKGIREARAKAAAEEEKAKQK